jgi:hypothetical protein
MRCYKYNADCQIGHTEYTDIKPNRITGAIGKTICRFLCWACYAGW